MSLRLSVATEDLGSSLKKAIGIAASLEIAGIRLNTRSELNAATASESALKQTLLYVKERQMNVAGLFCPTRHALYDTEYLEPRLEIIRKSMSLVGKLQTQEILIRCGRIPDPTEPDAPPQQTGIDDQANPFSFATDTPAPSDAADRKYSLLCEVLNELTRYGNHVGCTLTLQLAEYKTDMVRRLLADVKEGPLMIALDSATAIMTGTNAVDVFRDLYSSVGYVRARDALRDVDGAGTEVAVGDGIVDWTELLPTLEEAGYRGWICAERTGGEDREDDVRRGIALLKERLPHPAN